MSEPIRVGGPSTCHRCGQWCDGSYVHVCPTPPPTTTEDQVEAAMAELREMFPGKFIKLSRTEGRMYDEKTGEVLVTEATAWVFVGADQLIHEVEPTLAEAMAKVREWKSGEPKPE